MCSLVRTRKDLALENLALRQQLLTDGNGKVTTYTYDPTTGDRRTVTDPLGQVTTYTYDSGGRVLTVRAPAQGTTTYVPVGFGGR